jgi:hypothetical protein
MERGKCFFKVQKSWIDANELGSQTHDLNKKKPNDALA